jgi:hypothetical protein
MSRPCQCLGLVIGVVLGFYPAHGRGPWPRPWAG